MKKEKITTLKILNKVHTQAHTQRIRKKWRANKAGKNQEGGAGEIISI